MWEKNTAWSSNAFSVWIAVCKIRFPIAESIKEVIFMQYVEPTSSSFLQNSVIKIDLTLHLSL